MKTKLDLPAFILSQDTNTIFWFQKLLDAVASNNVGSVSSYIDNAAAVAGGLKIGDIYRNGDTLCVVH